MKYLCQRKSVAVEFVNTKYGSPQLRRQVVVTRAATTLPSKFSKVSPVGDRVLVKVEKEQATSVGGILLPASAQKKKNRGTITEVGKAKDVAVGDSVIYSKYAGTDLEVSDDTYVLLKESDVIGKLDASGSIGSLQPLGSRVLLKVPEQEQATQGGVLLTNDAAEKPSLGEVIAVGQGDLGEDGKREEVNVQVGSTVMYGKYSGTEFEDGDVKYVVLKDSEILAALS